MDTARSVVAADTVFLVRECGGPAAGGGPAGSGSPPVLLLHGVPETSSCWRDVGPALATGRRVLAPDLPGLGGSRYSGPYDVPALVGQLAALIEHEVTGPVDLVGHDWGGILALGLAALRPDLVRRLAVANAPYRTPPPLWRALHIPLFALPVVPELSFRAAGRRIVDLMLSAGWKAATPLDAERRAEYEAAYARPGNVKAMLGYYRAAARPALRSRLHGLLPPARLPDIGTDRTLVLWGAADPVLPLSTGETVVRELGAGCRMVVVPGAGHFVVEEATEVVSGALLEFLS